MVRRGIRGRRAVIWSAASVLVAGGAVAADAGRHLTGDYHVYTVRGRAMTPLLEPGDRVLVADTVTVQDGGVVLLDVGRTATDGPAFKRVLGHAGDRLYCCSEDGIRRNGAAMDEPYVRGTSFDFDVTVGPHQLFVLGDDRGRRPASRCRGTSSPTVTAWCPRPRCGASRCGRRVAWWTGRPAGRPGRSWCRRVSGCCSPSRAPSH